MLPPQIYNLSDRFPEEPTMAKTLLELARDKFGELTEAEEKLFEAIEKGEPADYRSAQKQENNPAKAQKWGKERALGADRVAWLFTSPDGRSRVTHMGVRISGARIDGYLDLQLVSVRFQLFLTTCAIPDGIVLIESEIGRLYLTGSHTGPIVADAMTVRGSVFMNQGFQATGEVRLLGAKIDGSLACRGGSFEHPMAAKDPAAEALSADRITVKGGVFMNKGYFKAKGEVRLAGAVIGSNLECTRGTFEHPMAAKYPAARAMNAEGISVKGGVFMDKGFKATGEVKLLGATIDGDLACRGGSFEHPMVAIDPAAKALNVDRIRVKGSVFINKGFKAKGEVRLRGAIIGSNLECTRGIFEHPRATENDAASPLNADRIRVKGSVFMKECTANGEVRLLGAIIGGNLECTRATFEHSGATENPAAKALNADRIRVKGSVFMKECTANGEVRLLGATIGSNLECDKGAFKNPGGKALSADNIDVKGSVFLRDGFNAEGEVRLPGATIGRQLSCEKGEFKNPEGTALSAENGEVKGGVLLRCGFKAEGEVRLVGATVGGELDCEKAHFKNREGDALNANRIEVKGSAFLRDAFKAEGRINFVSASIGAYFFWAAVSSDTKATLDLRSARIATFRDDKKSWPQKGGLLLNGLVYDEIGDGAPVDAESRIDWVRRQPTEPFRPQPYEQLARVLKESGHEEAATRVLIAKNEDLGKCGDMRRPAKPWHWNLGWTIRYGYRAGGALWIGLFLALIGWALFGIGETAGVMTPSKKDAYVTDKNGERSVSDDYSKFSPLIYSADAFIPLVDLQQQHYWRPNANRSGRCYFTESRYLTVSGWWLRVYMWAEIFLGWILTTLFVLGLSGLIRR
jgi:hypothetical protein